MRSVMPDPRHQEARALLRSLCGPHGIHASGASTANYRAVFARDAVMAGVAGLLVGDDTITAGFVRTLEGLRATQGEQGQIASNYELRGSAPAHVSFGTLAPRIDGATWYLVGVALAARAGAIDAGHYRHSVERVATLLEALEYNGRHLVFVPPGGNWADEYVYDGYILYDQVLRAWGLRLLGTTYGVAEWTAKSAAIADTIADRFRAADTSGASHPLASVSPTGSRNTFDLAACSLLALSGAAPSLAGAALDWITEHYLVSGKLPPAFHPVIDEQHPEWPALRRYHLHAFRNLPHEYHNGGIWPIWLGWLALALADAGRGDALAALRRATTAALEAWPAFRFEEFLHGVTGAPGGTPQMAYSATGIIFLAGAGSQRQREFLAP